MNFTIIIHDKALRISRMFLSFAIFFTVFVCTCPGCTSGGDDTDIFVHDGAKLLNEEQKSRIIKLNRALLADLDIHIVVDILEESPEDIDRRASDLFDRYSLGEQTRGNKGVLFLVDPQGKQVRLEIGYDLEEIFPDGFVGYIERRQMSPYFQAGKMGAGVEATVELFVGKALGEIDAGKYVLTEDLPQISGHFSGGAGAKTTVEIGSKALEKEAAPLNITFTAQPTPIETLQRYKEVLRLHIKDPDLGIYTSGTRAFFSKWLVTDAQQDNELSELTSGAAYSVFKKDNLAVLVFPIEDRRLSPYLFSRDDSGWMLDFASMSKYIGFNHKNQWFFRTTDHEFMFAFGDYSFDRLGFPHKKK